MDYPICNLCRNDSATQKNSHILPKFLKKEFLKTEKKFYIYNYYTQQLNIVQDLPKEDYILCPCCEQRIQTVETLASCHLNNSYHILKRKKYPKINLLDFEYQLLKNCNPKIFTLFVYTLIWRLHISKTFVDYELPNNCAEDLRKTLNEVLPNKISDFEDKLKLIDNQRWNYIFIKPEKRKGLKHNINFNGNIKNQGISIVYIFEYIIMFYVNNTQITSKLHNYMNNKFKEIKVVIFDNKFWNVLAIEAAILNEINYAL